MRTMLILSLINNHWQRRIRAKHPRFHTTVCEYPVRQGVIYKYENKSNPTSGLCYVAIDCFGSNSNRFGVPFREWESDQCISGG